MNITKTHIGAAMGAAAIVACRAIQQTDPSPLAIAAGAAAGAAIPALFQQVKKWGSRLGEMEMPRVKVPELSKISLSAGVGAATAIACESLKGEIPSAFTVTAGAAVGAIFSSLLDQMRKADGVALSKISAMVPAAASSLWLVGLAPKVQSVALGQSLSVLAGLSLAWNLGDWLTKGHLSNQFIAAVARYSAPLCVTGGTLAALSVVKSIYQNQFLFLVSSPVLAIFASDQLLARGWLTKKLAKAVVGQLAPQLPAPLPKPATAFGLGWLRSFIPGARP